MEARHAALMKKPSISRGGGSDKLLVTGVIKELLSFRRTLTPDPGGHTLTWESWIHTECGFLRQARTKEMGRYYPFRGEGEHLRKPRKEGCRSYSTAES